MAVNVRVDHSAYVMPGAGRDRGDHRDAKRSRETAGQFHARARRLPPDGSHTNGECQDSRTEPDREPALGSRLPRGDRRGGQAERAHRHSAEPRHGGEQRAAFHGLADESQIVSRAIVQ
jgi:hypothetical protein